MEKLPDRIQLEAGRIILFKKRHGKGHAQDAKQGKIIKNWYASILVDKSKRKIVSTGFANLAQAKKKAQELAFEYTALQHQGLSLRSDKFEAVGEQCYRHYLRECERKDAVDLHDDYYSKFQRIWLPHLYNKTMSSITAKQINDIFIKRSQERRDGKRLKPSTLSKDLTAIRMVFKHATKQGIINQIPEFPNVSNTEAFKPRPSLTEDEWKTLNATLRTYSKAKGIDDHTRYYREACRDWCQVIAYSGIRTGEASRLKWKDWQEKTVDGVKYGLIHIRADEKKARKTGARKVVVIKYVNTTLKRRFEKTPFKDPEDYIFSHFDRPEPIQKFRGSWDAAIEISGVGYKDGKRLAGYTPYILRHTAATLALTMRNVDIYALALNLGNQMTTTEKFYSKAKPEDFAKQLGNLDF